MNGTIASEKPGRTKTAGQEQRASGPESGRKPFEPADVYELSNLVGYQSGSIVSREIVKGAKGKVMLFAFDQEEALSEHTSPFDALVQVLEGEVEITVSGKPHQVKAGEIILMPAQHPHALKALTRFKMLLTMIRP